jgi:hypothetical protein
VRRAPCRARDLADVDPRGRLALLGVDGGDLVQDVNRCRAATARRTPPPKLNKIKEAACRRA